MGIDVEHVHAESAPGQIEVTTGPASPVVAADNLILTREAIAAVAKKHGLLATFIPKYDIGQAGNGCHCNFSLKKVRPKICTICTTFKEAISTKDSSCRTLPWHHVHWGSYFMITTKCGKIRCSTHWVVNILHSAPADAVERKSICVLHVQRLWKCSHTLTLIPNPVRES